MRHRKHNHQLGVKSAHRVSLVANLSCSLIEHGRIKTTLAKARALRPAIEKIITLAKKAHQSDDAARKVHYRRVAIARLRNKKAVSKLFDELVDQFLARNGGYTRIYKLALPRLGDAADMALIEFVEEAPKKKSKKKKATSQSDTKKKAKSAENTPNKKDSGKEDTVSEEQKIDTLDDSSTSDTKDTGSSVKEQDTAPADVLPSDDDSSEKEQSAEKK